MNLTKPLGLKLKSKRIDDTISSYTLHRNIFSSLPSEQQIEISGTLEEDLTLEPGYYTILQNDLVVAPKVTLKILPGTVLEFGPGKKLLMQGFLDVSEYDVIPVFFRGHENNEWGGIEVFSEFWDPPARALLRHVVIERAKEAVNLGPRASITIEENSIIRNNKMVSYYVLGHMVIRESEIACNTSGWTVHSIGKNPLDHNRIGHLELSRNIIRGTDSPFQTKGYGKLTLRNNFQIQATEL